MGAGRPSQQGTRKRKSPQADARNFPETGRPQTRGKWRVSPWGTEAFAVPKPHKQRGEASLRLLPGPLGGSHRVQEVQASRYARQQKE